MNIKTHKFSINLSQISTLFLTAIFCTLQFTSFSQLPNKVTKLVGTWNYTAGSGYEIFKLENNILVGESYLKTKVGKTYHVENIKIKYINKNLVYETTPVQLDSVLVNQKSTFIADGNRMKFAHLEDTYPSVVRYKLGFFNKNKLKIIIYPILKEQKKKVLHLTRNTDGTL